MRASLQASLAMLALLLGACGSNPAPPDPPRLRAALEVEGDGARRYARGDLDNAARRFDEAARQLAAIDDAPGVARNRLHLARTELARGRAEVALQVLEQAMQTGAAGPEPLLLRAQALLALGRLDAARRDIALAAAQCASPCPQGAGLHLLRGRAALMAGAVPDALADAAAALKLALDANEPNETGNAWRLLAAARLAAGDPAAALAAAESALETDRRLALPEKIARDWLLIADIRRKVGAGDTAIAYRRALDVARAAGLDELAVVAAQALETLAAAGSGGR